ncbi:MAG: hypothetical protein ABIR62_00060 [Dokdonella sp.]|uniref:hypothetical protein n=1 Tax=Dokdonella sp. TaxID=2291710 RepID=UPI003267E4F4
MKSFRLHFGWRVVVAASGLLGAMSAPAASSKPDQDTPDQGMVSGTSYQNDVSLPLYYLPAWNGEPADEDAREAAQNPKVPNHHVDVTDPVIQHTQSPISAMPLSILSFDGMGPSCGCAPPDTNGEVGATQFVQMTNSGYQVYNKTTGASVLGPLATSAIWAGFGGVCETSGHGDPIVLYDQLAQRWLISQFAGGSTITDECVAISTTSDATGSYNRYGFHLGSNFFDYPHLGMWPDGYYMSMNVFNASGTAYLGPQPFAFDRAAMIAGTPGATFVTTAAPLGATEAPFLPADLDGNTLPPIGASNPFAQFPDGGTYKVYRFHSDFATPANSTFSLAGSPAAAGFTTLCDNTRACVPQSGASAGDFLDAIGDRLMFRLAYRNFGSHESLVGNYTVSASSVAGIRWFELRNVTSGTVSVFQESTYQPDTTWRWMGSVAMDTQGNMALGYSASSSSINPQIRYAGRLVGDPVGTLPQAEAHLIDGGGHQSGTGNRWGDYSALSVDPVDDCTFWFTSEYYSTTGTFGWKTRIGNFKFPGCSLSPGFTLAATPPTASVCVGTPATFSVAVGSTVGFNSPVTLAATGNPAPTTTGFSPNPVTPLPGNSTLTVSNTAGVASGTYPVQINGTATGATAQSATVNLTVFASPPAAPTLTSPANASNGQAVRPTFSWTGSNTENYTIQVATDAGFGTIVFTQTVTGTQATPSADLGPNTVYYWRVTPANACGAGTSSPVFTFTTANLICTSPNLAIPDSVAAGVTSTLVVSDASVLTGLKLQIKASHTWVGDLKFTLSKSASSSVVIDRPGVPASVNGCNGDDINVTLDDGSAVLVENQCNASAPAISGVDKPNNPIGPVFAGQSLAGTWNLNVADLAGGDTGTLIQWCLMPQTSSGATYTVGGNVSGLVGTGLVLKLNGSENLPVSTNGSFTFATALANGAPYAVTVGAQPGSPAQTCTVSNGNGTIGSANVTNVAVTCVTTPPPTFTVGGSVSGLAGTGLVLQLNGGSNLSISANGSFTFTGGLVTGSPYVVTVGTQPASPAQVCTVSNGSGAIGSANVTNVAVSCSTTTYTVGGTVSGLAGAGLTLQLNGGSTLPVSANGTFTFSGALAGGSPYTVTVSTQPTAPSQVCTVANATGVIATSNVTNVTVTCATSSFTVGGTVSGLVGSGLVLQLNGAGNIAVAANGSFTFPTPQASGTAYVVTVGTQPTNPTELCTVSNGSGTVGSSNVTNIAVTCSDTIFKDGFEG